MTEPMEIRPRALEPDSPQQIVDDQTSGGVMSVLYENKMVIAVFVLSVIVVILIVYILTSSREVRTSARDEKATPKTKPPVSEERQKELRDLLDRARSTQSSATVEEVEQSETEQEQPTEPNSDAGEQVASASVTNEQ